MQESHFVSIFESVASEVMGSKALIGRKASLIITGPILSSGNLVTARTTSETRGAGGSIKPGVERSGTPG
jgi:hypothetical protein